jgi:hypothetical protein
MSNEERKGDWMQTASGGIFYPMDPRPEEIKIGDIAHALSMNCRYGGHCTRFYSVAEHSVYVSQHVAPENALYGLLHDAAEAYISDIIRPAKPYIQGYAEAEANIMRAICYKFGLPQEMPEDVKRVDNAILVDEMEQLMLPPPKEWNIPSEGLGITIEGKNPAYAEMMFLNRYRELISLDGGLRLCEDEGCPHYKSAYCRPKPLNGGCIATVYRKDS